MSCYLRHLKKVLAMAGVEPQNKADRKAVDQAVREITGVGDLPCNEVWKLLKPRMADPAGEEGLAAALKNRLKG